MKKKFGIVAFSILSTIGNAQTIIPISDEGVNNTMQCSGPITLTDSDVNGGAYGPNENYTITLCGIAGSESSVQFVVSPAIFGNLWDVDGNSELYIYDGASTASPLLGVFNSVTSPDGINVTGTTTCLTFTFISGPSASGQGFTGSFQCVYPLQPFLVQIHGTPEPTPWGGLDHNSIRFCFGDSVILNASVQYPLSDAGGNGYPQSDEISVFRWDMGDGTIYQGQGLTEIYHTYSNPFGYQVTLTVTDDHGQGELESIYVLYAPRPDFTNLISEDTLCIGEATVISGGILEGETIGVSPSTSAILGGGILGEQLFLPDGTGDNYITTINISDFGPDQVIESATDIVSMCVNMEHSFLGDLEMMLTCPNGTSINIFNSYNGANEGQLFPDGFGGGGTFLGEANETFPSEAPGIGFDYCFANTSNLGTFGEALANGYTQPVTLFTPGTAMSPGTFLPEETYASFIGCPINGDWTLTVRDSWGSDDGWIFNWSIYFDPNINPTTIYYSPDIDSVYWADNVDIIENSGPSITVQPSAPGDNSFTFFALDEFGCLHDTTVNVYIRPLTTISNAIACDLTHTLVPANAPNGGTWEIITTPTPDATADFNFINPVVAEVTASHYGIYNFLFTDANCGYEAEAEIDFRPDPQILPFPADTTLCVGASIVIDAGPQEANSDNFFINWTLNGTTFNTTDYAITANQTGTYALTITGVCGTVTESTDVISINVAFEGDTICGLQAFGQVTVSPEGSGIWSSDKEGTSFSNILGLSTSITALNYGNLLVTYTDNRCLNDGVSHNFRFVEQPVANIIPPDPEFCLESETLILSVETTGSDAGNYLWSINGNIDPINNDSIVFPPLTFEPLQDYVITVLVRDEFQVCPLAEGSSLFEGLWCTYSIPNVITPNGDGHNDRFHVEFMEYFPGTTLRVFDRWGKKVFENSNYDQFQTSTANGGPMYGGWDAKDVESGTYFYELLIPHARKVETGYIQVLDSQNAQ